MRTAHAKAQIRKRRETDFWRAVNGLLFMLIGLGVVVWSVLYFVPELRRIQEMRANLAGLQQDLTAQQLLLRQQQRQEKWLQNDPAYLEILARDRLGVMKDGETIFRLDEPVPATAPAAAIPAAPVAPAAAPAHVKASHGKR